MLGRNAGELKNGVALNERPLIDALSGSRQGATRSCELLSSHSMTRAPELLNPLLDFAFHPAA